MLRCYGAAGWQGRDKRGETWGLSQNPPDRLGVEGKARRAEGGWCVQAGGLLWLESGAWRSRAAGEKPAEWGRDQPLEGAAGPAEEPRFPWREGATLEILEDPRISVGEALGKTCSPAPPDLAPPREPQWTWGGHVERRPPPPSTFSLPGVSWPLGAPWSLLVPPATCEHVLQGAWALHALDILRFSSIPFPKTHSINDPFPADTPAHTPIHTLVVTHTHTHVCTHTFMHSHMYLYTTTMHPSSCTHTHSHHTPTHVHSHTWRTHSCTHTQHPRSYTYLCMQSQHTILTQSPFSSPPSPAICLVSRLL